jgi:hypothetical protein
MPITYVIDEERRLVVTTGSGVLTAAEIRAHEVRLKTNARFDPTFYELVDVTLVTKAPISADELRLLASAQVFSPKSRRAIIANRPVTFGLARMFEILREISGTEVETIHVFEDRASAMRWLGF